MHQLCSQVPISPIPIPPSRSPIPICRGHYRVLLGSPGSFRLSTEDNGISLREFWRICDADDDLRWAVFHYAGAARSVGQSYTGSLLVTRNGQVPQDLTQQEAQRIRKAFEKVRGTHTTGAAGPTRLRWF